MPSHRVHRHREADPASAGALLQLLYIFDGLRTAVFMCYAHMNLVLLEGLGSNPTNRSGFNVAGGMFCPPTAFTKSRDHVLCSLWVAVRALT